MRIIIRPAWNRHGYNVWLVHEDGTGWRLAKPLALEFGEPQSDQSAFLLPDPTMFLTSQDWESLKVSFQSEAIANGLSKDPARLQGELEATKKHLADLQRLTFEAKQWGKSSHE